MRYVNIGKFLLIISALIGILPLFVFLSLPIYIIGFVLIINSNLAKQGKIVWVSMPLIIVLIVWFIIWIMSV